MGTGWDEDNDSGEDGVFDRNIGRKVGWSQGFPGLRCLPEESESNSVISGAAWKPVWHDVSWHGSVYALMRKLVHSAAFACLRSEGGSLAPQGNKGFAHRFALRTEHSDGGRAVTIIALLGPVTYKGPSNFWLWPLCPSHLGVIWAACVILNMKRVITHKYLSAHLMNYDALLWWAICSNHSQKSNKS